jgi:uncharacterized protein DUF6719
MPVPGVRKNPIGMKHLLPSMRTLVTATFALGVCLLAGDICRAQFAPAAGPGDAPVVKREPFDGMMSPGAIVLVDDGSCGKGRIKEVTGGEVAPAIQRPRTRRCIAKPAR